MARRPQSIHSDLSKARPLIHAACLVFMLAAVQLSVYGQAPAPADCGSCENDVQVYNIHAVQSQVHFRLSSLAALSLTGVARHASGRILYSPVNREQSKVSVQLQTDAIDMNNPVYTRLVRSRPFLYVSQHPLITFDSTDITISGDGEWMIRGRLTLRGVSREETLAARLERADGDNGHIIFSATTSISRADYGMTSLRLLISDRIEFSIEITGIAAEPAAE